MLKKLLTAAIGLAGFTQAEDTTGDDRALSCVEYTSEWIKFDLRPLEKPEGETYFKEGIEWNFCKTLPSAEYFASINSMSDQGLHTVILTGDSPVASSKEAIKEHSGDITGISLTWDSEEPCPTASGTTTSFTARVTCDKMQSS